MGTDAAIVGREAELGLIDASLAGLSSSAGVVEFAGEPGIGKTRLLAALCERSDARKHLVLEGRASEFEREVPFAPFLDALDDYLGSLNPRVFEPLDSEERSELAQVLPSLAGLAEEGAPPLRSEERYRTHRAIRRLLELLAAKRPLVLALDDMHWADEASVELVLHLLRRPPGRPVLLVLSQRPTQGDPRLRAGLIDAARSDGALRVELGPLPADAAAALLGEEIDPELREALYREGGGNPFYLEQLARLDRETSPDPDAPDAPGGVPAGVAAAIGQELAALSDDVRLLLQAAAVAGDPFEPDLAAVAAEREESEALSAIDVLVERDLIRPTGVPRRFAFRHPIVHRAVYESSPEGWRLAAHGRLAAALADRGASALARAHHVESSARAGDAAAVAVLAEAGHAASARAPGVAVHWFEAAMRLLGEGEGERRVEFLVPLASARAAAGRYREARDDLGELLELLPADPALRGRLVALCSKLDTLLGRHGEARELLTGALEELPERRSEAGASLMIELGAQAFFGGDFAAQRRWLTEALESADEAGATRAVAIGLLAIADYMLGEIEAARRGISDSVARIDELGDVELADHLTGLASIATCATQLDQIDLALRLFARGIEIARSSGQGQMPVLMQLGEANALLWRGDVALGVERGEAALEAALLFSNRQFTTWGLWNECWGAIMSGGVTEAVRLGERAVESAGSATDPVSEVAGCYLAEALLEAGAPERSREQMLAAAGGPELPKVELPFRPRWYEVLARAELALDRVDAAADWVARGEAIALPAGVDSRTCDALRARAALELARGDGKAAAAAGRDAAAAGERAGARVDAARARVLVGRGLAAAGRADEAVAELEAASAELEARGAKRYRDEAARELRGLGRRVARPGKGGSEGAGVEALSKRELEVAELVAAGRKNREIGEQLFVSRKTVETHLRNIFAKLEVSSRAEVASAIGRRDRVA